MRPRFLIEGLAVTTAIVATTLRLRAPAPPEATPERPLSLGTPTTTAWREEVRAKAAELRGHLAWMGGGSHAALVANSAAHLDAAEAAAADRRLRAKISGATFERAIGNLDAVEADVLRLAPPAYFEGYLPSLRAHVNRYLDKDDPRRMAVEGSDGVALTPAISETLINAYHAASTQRRRDLMRLRSFRNLVFGGAALLTLVAGVLALLSWHHPTWIPLCFYPVEKQQLVCPTAEIHAAASPGMLDSFVQITANPHDMLLVELLGIVAAAVAGAVSLRRMRGTSTPFGVPVALAVLKLPTGALTAVLGLLLMGGGFVPGLSALDSSAQIVAWAIVFGYAQQLFTRMVDDQGSGLLNKVGGRGPGGDRDPASGA